MLAASACVHACVSVRCKLHSIIKIHFDLSIIYYCKKKNIIFQYLSKIVVEWNSRIIKKKSVMEFKVNGIRKLSLLRGYNISDMNCKEIYSIREIFLGNILKEIL